MAASPARQQDAVLPRCGRPREVGRGTWRAPTPHTFPRPLAPKTQPPWSFHPAGDLAARGPTHILHFSRCEPSPSSPPFLFSWPLARVVGTYKSRDVPRPLFPLLVSTPGSALVLDKTASAGVCRGTETAAPLQRGIHLHVFAAPDCPFTQLPLSVPPCCCPTALHAKREEAPPAPPPARRTNKDAPQGLHLHASRGRDFYPRHPQPTLPPQRRPRVCLPPPRPQVPARPAGGRPPRLPDPL